MRLSRTPGTRCASTGSTPLTCGPRSLKPISRQLDERGNARLGGRTRDGRSILVGVANDDPGFVIVAGDDPGFVITVFLRS
jgi:hypothetical protein